MGILASAVFYCKSDSGEYEGFVVVDPFMKFLPQKEHLRHLAGVLGNFRKLNDESIYQTIESHRNDSTALHAMERYNAAYDPRKPINTTK